MPLEGEYEPSPQQWVRDQVERYEATGGREANTLRDTGLPVVIFTTRGATSGNVRKHPDQVTVQDGPEPWDGVARELTGEEKAVWWERAVAAFPPYADYQRKTDREI